MMIGTYTENRLRPPRLDWGWWKLGSSPKMISSTCGTAITKGNDDRDVHGEQAETSEAGLGLVEAGQLAEDDQQHLRNRDTEDQAGRQPPGEPRLVADYRAERGPRC